MTVAPRSMGSQLVSAAFAALVRADVRWAQLRDRDREPTEGDVDLLVHPLDADHLDAALATAGFTRFLTWRHGYHRFFVAYDAPADGWIKLDFVTRLAYGTGGELPSDVAEAVLARAEPDQGGMHLLPDDEFWCLLLHCVLDRTSIPPRHLAKLQQLATGSEPAGPVAGALAVEGLTLRSAVDCARSGDAGSLARLAGPLGAGLARPAVRHRLFRSARHALAPVLRMVRQPGLSVALIGPDGAGKSTLIGSLSDRFFLPARSYYLGFYGASPGRTARSDDAHRSLFGMLGMAWRAYLRGGIERLRGRLVLFDRYGYDVLLPSRRGRTTWSRRARRVLVGRLSPRPDLVVILDATPTVLMARKGEHTIETLERQRRAYLALADELRGTATVEVLDAGQDAATVHRQVTKLLWDLFTRRRHQ